MSANSIYKIGLTGGIGSGKSEATKYLIEMGIPVLDADVISRRVTGYNGSALPQIKDAFGDEVFNADGTLNRAKLAQCVFSNIELRRMLEKIIHPIVQAEMMDNVRELSEAGEKIVVLSVPLLFETGMDALCDTVWLMAVNEDTRVNRIIARDDCTREQAELRIAAQMPQEQKIERANIVIDNNSGIDKLKQEINALIKRLIKELERQ